MDPRALDRIWYADDASARLLRGALLPLSWVHAGVSRARNVLYDRGVLRQHVTALPAIAVGNLTVGGTGKTPVAAELARRLLDRKVAPAIVLRGYGGDEPRVHEMLNPRIPVVVAADRIQGIAEARRRGARVVVLDDAFQHRRAQRAADVVLVSADAWRRRRRHSLPAGPWREPLSSLGRATLAVVTRKAAGDELVADLVSAIAAAAPECPRAVARIAPSALRRADGGEQRPIADLAGRRVALIAAIGDPAAFVRQIEAAGAVVEPSVFGDHHHFTAAQVDALAESAERADLAICTLKDAVKLMASWPRAAPPLWYVSQAVTFELGERYVEEILDGLVSVLYRTHHT